MRKKGQAAMEFLMTYGWAILAAVIVIGVLASFGVFSSSNYIPTSCSLTAPFGCDKNQVAADDATDQLHFVLKNGGGQKYNVTMIDVTGCTATAVTVAAVDLMTTNGVEVADQGTPEVILTCAPGELIADEKFTGDATITYRPIGGVLDLKSSGSVTVKVE